VPESAGSAEKNRKMKSYSGIAQWKLAAGSNPSGTPMTNDLLLPFKYHARRRQHYSSPLQRFNKANRTETLEQS
jgi:hypothetical protein